MAGVHEDFGEKIGGAKKDLWKDRGLYADDLEAMNEREAEKFVKKDNVWKKPDYAAMLEEGIPLGVVYFIKKARDGLNASPQYYRTDDTPEKRTARQKEYIKTVRELQTVLSDVRTVEDAVRAYDRFFVDNVLLISATPYQWKHIIGQRVCRRNTDETRIVLLKVWKELYDLSPALFAPSLTGPFCQLDRCLEGKMTCGRKLQADMTPEDILEKDYPALWEGGCR